jgi:hypothetical protein
VVPSRSKSDQVLLTVGPQHVALETPDVSEAFEVPFDAAQFGLDRAPEGRPNALEARGQALWSAAFSGTLGSALDRAAARAIAHGASITLRVVPAPDLPEPLRWLPWELLFDPARRDFLTLKSGWSLVRGAEPYQRTRAIRTGRPRALILEFVKAGGGRYRSAEPEIDAIKGVIEPAGAARVERVADADHVCELLESTEFDIVHMIGRGDGGGLRLATTNSEGLSQVVSGDALAEAIGRNEHIALVVLSASHSERVADAMTRTAEVAVLAHRQFVHDEHAARLTSAFYPRLLEGLYADVALTETRRYLDRHLPGDRAWASAVLVTGWPPPHVPVDGRPAAGVPDEHLATTGSVADRLSKRLHARNSERARELLEVVRWDLVERQLTMSIQRLDELRAKASP